MAEQYHKKLIEPGEVVIFDKRHSLWEIWRNFIIGAGAIVALILLQTKFKPGPSDGTNWGYIILISAMALFVVLVYGAWPMFKRRRLPERHFFLPVLFMVLAAAGWGALMWFRNDEDFASIWSTVVWIAFVVVIIGWLIYPIFAWFFAHFVLTDRRLILSQGIINKSTMAMPLEMLNDVRTSQNAWERIFNYGDVVIETAGEFGQQPFTNIGHPLEVKKQIFEQRKALEEQQETMRGKEIAHEMATAMQTQAPVAPPAPAPAATDTSVVERLEKLSELHASGALSDAEFQRAKAELLEMDQEE
ncbi:MAG: PH domain-containing protein [Actinomycetota bacterium]